MAKTLKTHPYTWTEGNRLPELVGVLSGVNLTGYEVHFHLERPDGVVLDKTVGNGGVVIVDAATGKFKVVWAATDLIEGTGQVADVTFIDTGGLPLTSRKFKINVARKLAD